MGHSTPLFFTFVLINTVDIKQMFFIKVTNDWIRATDLWCWKQLLYQLSHTHPVLQNLFYFHWLNGIQKLNSNLELDLRDLVKIRCWFFSTFKTILQVVNMSKNFPCNVVVVQWSAYSPSSLTIRVRFPLKYTVRK